MNSHPEQDFALRVEVETANAIALGLDPAEYLQRAWQVVPVVHRHRSRKVYLGVLDTNRAPVENGSAGPLGNVPVSGLRRRKGEGSVRLRRDGRWEGRITLGAIVDGEPAGAGG